VRSVCHARKSSDIIHLKKIVFRLPTFPTGPGEGRLFFCINSPLRPALRGGFILPEESFHFVTEAFEINKDFLTIASSGNI